MLQDYKAAKLFCNRAGRVFFRNITTESIYTFEVRGRGDIPTLAAVGCQGQLGLVGWVGGQLGFPNCPQLIPTDTQLTPIDARC